MNTLVIAYGNPLRGDDGLGPALGAMIESWNLPNVRVLIGQQLAPEMMADLSECERVLFVDAALPQVQDAAFALSPVCPDESRPLLGHHETPGKLIALVRKLEGRCPEAWLLSVAGASFEYSPDLGESARANLRTAAGAIRAWLE